MKTAIKILLGMCIFFFAVSCEKDEAATPQAAMTVNKNRFMIKESMVVHFTGFAEQVVIYTGDDMHDYELRQKSNTGFVVNKGLFTYSYDYPGTYKVVCVASSFTDGAVDLKRDTCSFMVTVIDDQAEIANISCPQILYDEVFAERLENDRWLMRLPRKVKYNNATPSISLSQRLNFYIQSDSTKVFVNNKAFSATEKYDLSVPSDILVRSNYGTERKSRLFTIYYPEFSTFRLNGINGTLVRNEFDYSVFEMQVILPAGADIRSLVPEFTTISAADKVYIGNTEQVSGTTPVDFTRNVSYRLVSSLPENPEMQSVSVVNVKISYQ